MLAAYESLADMDIIHDHTFLGPLISGLRGLRWPLSRAHATMVRSTVRPEPVYTEIARHASLVAISQSQADQAEMYGGAQIAGVIHHGIDLEVYKAGTGGGGYVIFIGRMSPDKGVHHAVRRRQEGRQAAGDVHEDARGQRDRLLRRRGRSRCSTRDDEMPAEIPQERRIELLRGADAHAQPDHLARAFRPRHGGGTRVRHAGARLPERGRAGDH